VARQTLATTRDGTNSATIPLLTDSALSIPNEPVVSHSLRRHHHHSIAIGLVGMAQRRGLHSRLQSNATTTTNKTSALPHNHSKPRHQSSSHRRVFSLIRSLRNVNLPSSASTSPSSSESRPVLAPLQFNLRRLPSRLALANEVVMRVSSGSEHVKVGAKRKRAVSGTENTHNFPRGSRNGPSGFKRRKSSPRYEETSDDEVAAAMEIDTHTRGQSSDVSSDEDASDWDSCTSYIFLVAAFLMRLCSR
jgi:mitogen-activated protein kinase kinase kinase 13